MAKFVSWEAFFEAQRRQRWFGELSAFVTKERQGSVPVYPGSDDVFGFTATPLQDVRVVVLGQDPYPGRGQAHGLAFSYKGTGQLPRSLANIFQELYSDLGSESIVPRARRCALAAVDVDTAATISGDLTPWTRQGVLLLNTALTVRQGEPGSHLEAWRPFTDEVVRAVVDSATVAPHFVLWGAHAKQVFERTVGPHWRSSIVDGPLKDFLLGRRISQSGRYPTATYSAHPSPLSADRGFFGSQPFSRANLALKLNNPGVDVAVDWRLP